LEISASFATGWPKPKNRLDERPSPVVVLLWSAFANKELDPDANLDLAQSLGYDAVELAPEPLRHANRTTVCGRPDPIFAVRSPRSISRSCRGRLPAMQSTLVVYVRNGQDSRGGCR
jgi:hypothetical protein